MSDRINIFIDWGEILRQSKKKMLSERNSNFKTDRKYRIHKNTTTEEAHCQSIKWNMTHLSMKHKICNSYKDYKSFSVSRCKPHLSGAYLIISST